MFSKAKKGATRLGIDKSENQNILLQKRAFSPTSLITLAEARTSIWAVNFVYQSCGLPAGLVMSLFCECSCFEAMSPLSEVLEDAVPPGIMEPSHSLDENVRKMLNVRLTKSYIWS